jgi:hypothetical protein
MRRLTFGERVYLVAWDVWDLGIQPVLMVLGIALLFLLL